MNNKEFILSKFDGLKFIFDFPFILPCSL